MNDHSPQDILLIEPSSLRKLFTNRFWLWRSAMQTKAVPALASWSRPAVAARGQLPGLAGH